MADLIFPSNPTTGQEFTGTFGEVFTWDGVKWTLTAGGGGGGGASVIISETAPGNPTAGMLWWATDVAKLYFWDGTQWVIVVNTPGGGGGGGGGGGVQSITAGEGLIGGTIIDDGTIALSSPVAIADGGTNSSTVLGARSNLDVNTFDVTLQIPGPVQGGMSCSFPVPPGMSWPMPQAWWFVSKVPPATVGQFQLSLRHSDGSTVSTVPFSINAGQFTGNNAWLVPAGITFLTGDFLTFVCSNGPSDGAMADVTFFFRLTRTT